MMRIATMNIWNTQGPGHRYRNILPAVLAACRPDVMLLQEVGFDDCPAPQSIALAGRIGLMSERYFFSGRWQGREEGLAILARYPMLHQYVRPLPQAADGMARIVCGATLATPMGEVDVFTTHLAFPLLAGADRKRQATAVLDFLRFVNPNLADRPLIFGGDLNDEPMSEPVQVFTGAACPLRDVLWDRQPDERITFSSRNPYARPELGTDRCIDYLFCSEQLAVERAELFGFEEHAQQFASDHLGILADVRVL